MDDQLLCVGYMTPLFFLLNTLFDLFAYSTVTLIAFFKLPSDKELSLVMAATGAYSCWC
jgi:hypothetical protein